MTWPNVILILGLLFLALCTWAGVTSYRRDRVKLEVDTSHADEVRNLVGRYEQLAASTLDA
jgi:hypothetical protein